jgi:hypothetical protein
VKFKHTIFILAVISIIYLGITTVRSEQKPLDARPLVEAEDFCDLKVCALHGTSLQKDIVPIIAGLQSAPTVMNHKRLFPHANKAYNNGCLGGRYKYAEVLYCSQCRRAETWWRLKQVLLLT